MATLRTNYKDDVLDTSQNQERVYRVMNGSTTVHASVSLEDITVYSQQGDSFGAADINATNAEVNGINARIPYTIVSLTQAQYDALATKDANTIYLTH